MKALLAFAEGEGYTVPPEVMEAANAVYSARFWDKLWHMPPQNDPERIGSRFAMLLHYGFLQIEKDDAPVAGSAA